MAIQVLWWLRLERSLRIRTISLLSGILSGFDGRDAEKGDSACGGKQRGLLA